MKIFYYSRSISSHLKNGSVSCAFIPTMGALHNGHLHLVTEAKKNFSNVGCSIFVNPKQFNNPDDLKKYPKTIKSDLEKLASIGCDWVFIPSFEQIYPSNFTDIQVELGNLNQVLEGVMRPGHYQGVVNVLFQLFSIIEPAAVYFGLKDLQQCMVVSKLIKSKFPKMQQYNVETLRENTGLAMSSRNMRLSENAKEKAAHIYKELSMLKNSITQFNTMKEHSLQNLLNLGIETEYLNLVNLPEMELMEKYNNTVSAIVFAGWLEGVRLIDNVMVE